MFKYASKGLGLLSKIILPGSRRSFSTGPGSPWKFHCVSAIPPGEFGQQIAGITPTHRSTAAITTQVNSDLTTIQKLFDTGQKVRESHFGSNAPHLITTIDTPEFSFYPWDGGYLTAPIFYNNLIPGIFNIARFYQPHYIFCFGTFPVVIDPTRYMNVAVFGQCGPKPRLGLLAKENKPSEDFGAPGDPFPGMKLYVPPEVKNSCHEVALPDGSKIYLAQEICADNEEGVALRNLNELMAQRKLDSVLGAHKLCSNTITADRANMAFDLLIQADPYHPAITTETGSEPSPASITNLQIEKYNTWDLYSYNPVPFSVNVA